MKRPNEIIALIAGYGVEYFMYIMFGGLPFSKSVIEVCASVAFVFWLIKKFALRDYELAKTPLNLPILAFIIVNIAAAARTNFPDKSLEAFFFKIMEFVVLYFIIVECINTKTRIRNSIIILITSLLLASVDGIFQYFKGVDFMRHRVLHEGMRITGPFGMPTDFGGYLAMVVPLAVCLFMFGPKRKWKIILGTASFLSLTVLFLTFSRAALLGFFAAAALIGILKSKKTLAATIIAIALVICVPNPVGRNLKTTIDPRHASNDWRLARWAEIVDMIKDKPFFGHGLNTFSKNYGPYYNDIKYYHANRPSAQEGLPYAHNCYLQMAAETGIIGLGVFLWILFIFYKSNLKVSSMFGQDNFYKASALGLIGGVSACLTQSMFDTNLYSLQLSIFCWLLIALIFAIRQDTKIENG